MKRIIKIVVLVSIVVLFYLGWIFLFSSDGEPIYMGQSQSQALNEREAKSIDIQKRNTKKIKVIQQGEVKIIERNSVQIDSVKLILDDNIGMAVVTETENYLLLYTPFLNSDGPNISKYSKDGKLISSFGRKGRGPGEVISIESVSEKNHQVYISDNGYLKIYNPDNVIKSTFDVKSWANLISVNTNSIDLLCSYSKVFAFPIININSQSGEINFIIKDNADEILNDLGRGPSTTFFTTDSLIFYVKRTEPVIYIFDKVKQEYTIEYRLESSTIIENVQKYKSKVSSDDEIEDYVNNLWKLEAITVYDNKVVCLTNSPIDGQRRNYLLCFDLKNQDSDEIPLIVYDISLIKKLYNKRLFKNKLYNFDPGKEGYNMYCSINLKEIIK